MMKKGIEIDIIVGLSEEPVVQREKEAVGSGGGSTWEVVAAEERRKQQRRRRTRMKEQEEREDVEDEEGEENEEGNNNSGGGCERQREHPFIVTEPGEVARGKKNGLDYLFHLYEQCREFLMQVQAIAKDRGEKCPTKVFLSWLTHSLTHSLSRVFLLITLTLPLTCVVVLFRLNNVVLPWRWRGTRDRSGSLVRGPSSFKTGILSPYKPSELSSYNSYTCFPTTPHHKHPQVKVLHVSPFPLSPTGSSHALITTIPIHPYLSFLILFFINFISLAHPLLSLLY